MRRSAAEVRKVSPDPVYGSILVSQVVNKVLWKGKKELSRKIVYDALTLVERRRGDDPLNTLKRAILLRNPYVDPMSLLQVDLLARWRATDRTDDTLLQALLVSVNGIAQGLQNTG